MSEIKNHSLFYSTIKLVIITCIVGMIAVGISGWIFFSKINEFRSAVVIEIAGTATIKRDNASFDVVEGMKLTQGDYIKVSTNESYLRILLDEDKYICLGADTEIELIEIKKGLDNKSKVKLIKGSVKNEKK